MEPPRLIEYDIDIHGLLRRETREDGDECLLTFTNAAPVPEDWLVLCLAGWHVYPDYLTARSQEAALARLLAVALRSYR